MQNLYMISVLIINNKIYFIKYVILHKTVTTIVLRLNNVYQHITVLVKKLIIVNTDRVLYIMHRIGQYLGNVSYKYLFPI